MGPQGCSEEWCSLSPADFATLLSCTEQEGGIFHLFTSLRGECAHCSRDVDLQNCIKAPLYAQLLLSFILRLCLNIAVSRFMQGKTDSREIWLLLYSCIRETQLRDEVLVMGNIFVVSRCNWSKESCVLRWYHIIVVYFVTSKICSKYLSMAVPWSVTVQDPV